MNSEDFNQALSLVKKHTKLNKIRDLDRRIENFCSGYNERIGFHR
jgi:hypothetical protein